MKTIKRINESQIRNIVAKAIKQILNEGLLDRDSSINPESKETKTTSYYVIGFAKKFYTLWQVFESKYSRNYFFIKNISFSKEKAMSLYPDAKFSESLRGRTKSFTERISNEENEENEENGRRFNFNRKPNTPLWCAGNGDNLKSIDVLVTDAYISYTKYNKPYYRVECDDVNDIYSPRLIFSIFNETRNSVLPHKGDMLNITGDVFSHTLHDVIFLNNVTINNINRLNTYDDNTHNQNDKISNIKAVVEKVKKSVVDDYKKIKINGFIEIKDEDGNNYIVETSSIDYRTGELNQKFDDKFRVGDKLIISGRVVEKNSYKYLQYFKYEFLERCEDDDYKETQKILKFIGVSESSKMGPRGNTETKNYRLSYEDTKEYLTYISEIINNTKNNSHISCSYYPVSSDDGQNYYDEYKLDKNNNIGDVDDIVKYITNVPDSIYTINLTITPIIKSDKTEYITIEIKGKWIENFN